ncbi:MAG: hypothetical protein LUD15_13215 [Bacteroides sp.]|nr:hypothetical protein [Bacteroides sp.]
MREIFIPVQTRSFITDTMDIRENWNRFTEIISRPTVALALQWMREVHECRCEVYIKDLSTGWYGGYFHFPDMEERIETKPFPTRDKAESELLTRAVDYRIRYLLMKR